VLLQFERKALLILKDCCKASVLKLDFGTLKRQKLPFYIFSKKMFDFTISLSIMTKLSVQIDPNKFRLSTPKSFC